MKKETYANKLAELLGLPTPAAPPAVGKGKKQNLNTPVGISEDDIQSFRAAQGLIYFLQAPALFTPKKCPHCGESFLVSRQYVSFCSYTCIRKDLEERGIKWSKGEDYEALANDPAVYEGNEPIWIKNLDAIQAVLDKARSLNGRDEGSTSS